MKRDRVNNGSRKLTPTGSIDPDIVGLWQAPDGAMTRIAADGWNFTAEMPSPYHISVDGSTLTFTGPNPDVVYYREYGTGQSLIGSWTLTYVDGADTWIEQMLYRTDGSYTSHWSLNGKFDLELLGNYQDFGNTMSHGERRARISTTSTNGIEFDVLYGPDFSGTYSKTDADNWVLTISGSTVSYTRVPEPIQKKGVSSLDGEHARN